MTSESPNPAAGSPLPARKERLWTRRDGDEVVVYDDARGVLHRLNPSALAIWELCDGSTTLEELTEAIVRLTDSAPEEAEKQVRDTIDRLSEAGLLDD